MTEYNKYNDAKIYKLSNTVDDKFYVGSTVDTLCARFSDHKSNSKRHPNRDVYKHFIGIGWDKVSISLVCNFKCNNIKELHIEEARHIDLLKPQLNQYKATRLTAEMIASAKSDREIKTMKERIYFDTNKDLITKQRKDWHEKNIDRVKAVRNAVIQCECGKTYTHANVLRHKNSVFHTKFIEQHITI